MKRLPISMTILALLVVPQFALGADIDDLKAAGEKMIQPNTSLSATAFKLGEVDQPPRLLRPVPPRYPYEARRNGIEGRVVIRFVVNAEGDVLEPEVAEVEPPDIAGVFDEAALQAVARYKFKAAIKDGEPVDCIVKLPIVFELR
jgi:protein TonB